MGENPSLKAMWLHGEAMKGKKIYIIIMLAGIVLYGAD